MGNILIIVFKKQPDMLIVILSIFCQSNCKSNLLRILQISMNPNLFFFLSFLPNCIFLKLIFKYLQISIN